MLKNTFNIQKFNKVKFLENMITDNLNIKTTCTWPNHYKTTQPDIYLPWWWYYEGHSITYVQNICQTINKERFSLSLSKKNIGSSKMKCQYIYSPFIMIYVNSQDIIIWPFLLQIYIQHTVLTNNFK